MISDSDIRKHAEALGSGSRERSSSLVKQFKQREIVRFMKRNPIILHQIMQIVENDQASTNTHSDS
jgi:hypothetical protein